MKRDYDIIQHHFDRENINIFPLSDLHVGAPEFDLHAWETWKKKVLESKNNYVVIAGDLMNNATKSSVSNVFEETMRPREQKKWLAAELDAIKSKILCAVGGNHEARSGKDVDDAPLYDVLCKLNIEDIYRQNAAFMALRFGSLKNNGIKNPTYSVLVTHGAGGGMLTGAGVNRNERFGYVFDGLDILITGHTHRPLVTNPCKIKIDLQNNQVTQKPFMCVTATAWMDYGGYALRKMLPPASHKPQIITLCGNKKEFFVTM